jgi:hypothetical protein
VEQRIYANFDLLFESDGKPRTYRVRLVASPAGEAVGEFIVPFSESDLDGLLQRVRNPAARLRRLESRRRRAARQLGAGLFEALFTGDIGRCFRASLAETERLGQGLRLRFRLVDVPELLDLPWELLHDARADSFLALSVWTPIVRYLELPAPVKPITARRPLHVLVMISEPDSVPPLDVEEEWRRLVGALGSLEARGLVSLTRLADASLLTLQQALRDTEFHIFHFVGHGTYDDQHDDGVLVLEDGEGGPRPVSGRDLGAFLRDQRSLGLVVLNSCSGANTSHHDPFAGSAQSLVVAGIPSVVAMLDSISDDAALAFTSEFYEALAQGHGVDTALGEARRAMFGQGTETEWATPVLYMRASDGSVFDVAPGEHTASPDRKASPGRGGHSRPAPKGRDTDRTMREPDRER